MSNPMEELYRDDHLIVTPHTGGDDRVALFVGLEPDEERPHIVSASELSSVLTEYAGRFEETDDD